MEKESEFIKKVEEFQGEIRALMSGNDKKGLLLIAVDGDGELGCISGMLYGKSSELVCGIARAMKKDKAIREVINDTSSFYKFKEDPIRGVLDMLLESVDKVAEKRKAELEKAEELEEELKN